MTSDEAPRTAERPRDGTGKEGAFSFRLDRENAGKPVPDAAFLDSDGHKKTLGDFAGRPLLVNLWATWCAPCVAEMPTLDRIAVDHARDGLAVLTISQDTQGRAQVDPFFARHDLPHLAAWTDPENALGFHYATGLLPTTILYDGQGKEVVRVIGAMDWKSAEAKGLIDEALGKSPAA